MIIETTTNENPFPFVQLPPTKQKDMKELLIKTYDDCISHSSDAFPALFLWDLQ
jgi:hypothetical protein